MTMGTASTMTAAVGGARADAAGRIVDPGRRLEPRPHGAGCGRRIVDLAWEDRGRARILSPASFDNAITTVLALGGSTNVDHPPDRDRPARRLRLTLDRFDQLSRSTPVLADVRPGGRFLMEDFYYAGGLRALLADAVGVA